MSPSTRLARALSLWLPAVAWAALIFALSARSSVPDLPPHVTDKMVHAAAYAVLGGAIIRALAGGRWQGVTRSVVAAAILCTVLYGASDEFHQWFVPGRSVDAADLAADAAGGTAAALAALGARRLLDRRRTSGRAAARW